MCDNAVIQVAAKVLFALRVTDVYKHLGATIVSRRSTDPEARRRALAAMQGFRDVRGVLRFTAALDGDKGVVDQVPC